jgi:hypothetical protein
MSTKPYLAVDISESMPYACYRHAWARTEMYIGLWWRIILNWILSWGSMDWIDLAQDRDQQKVLANMVMNLLVP